MTDILSRHGNTFMVVSLLVCLSPYLLVSAFVQPSADDFFFSAWFREMSLAEYMRENMTCCNGRYTGVLLAGLMPLSFGWAWGMKLIPVLTILGLFLGIKAVLACSVDERSVWTRWILPLAGTLLLLHGLPSTAEGIYWVNASVFHTWAAIAVLFMIALISWEPKRNALRGALGALVALSVPGMNEVATLVLGLILTLHAFNTLFSTAQRRIWAFAWLGAFAIGVAALMLMPGTWARSSAIGTNLDAIFALRKASMLTVMILGQQLQQVPLLLFSLALLPSLKNWQIPVWDHCRLARLHWAVLLVLSIVSIWLIYFVATFLIGGYPPWRVHNSVAIVFLGLWFINLYHMSKRLSLPVGMPAWVVPSLLGIGFWMLATDFKAGAMDEPVFRGNTAHCAYDLLTKGKAYEQAMDVRYDAIRQAGPEDTVVVAPLSDPPLSIHHADIGPDPAALYNAICAYYYGIGAIRTDTLSHR